MKKKALQERKAALIKENGEHLEKLSSLTGEELTAGLKLVDEREVELKQIETDLANIEKLENRTRENASRNPAPARTEVRDNAEDKPWSGFGEQLQAIRTAALNPNAIDPRLQKLAALGANEAVGADGGFLVGKDSTSEILQEMRTVGVLAPKCRPVPISANSNGITMNGIDETSRANGSRSGGVQAYWAAEAATVTASKPKFRPIDLKLGKLLAFYYATDEIVADAAALGAIASKAFGEEMAFKVDDAIVRGPGAGIPLGILNSPSVASVAKEAGQAAGTVTYANIVKMYARMPARSKARAEWYINEDVMPQVMLMTVEGGTSSTPVYMPPTGAAGAPFGSLLGRPIIPIEHCETVGTVGDIIFGDFDQYLLATKGGVKQDESMHVAFLTSEMCFRFTYRCDGQTLRASALTPYKGANPLSAFVTLATRA